MAHGLPDSRARRRVGDVVSLAPSWLTGAWPPGLDLPRYFAMGIVVLAGACLQGIGGLGFAMFCAPIAALAFPQLVPAPILVLGCPLAALAAVRERHSIQWSVAGFALAGRLAGAVLAAFVVKILPTPLASILFALMILTGVVLSVRGWHVATTPANSAAAGLASGLMGTITSAGAPPLAIAMHNLEPAPLRATLGCIFLIGSVMSFAALAAVGRAGSADLVLGLFLAPWLLAGFAASGPIARRMSRAAMRNFLLTLAAFGAIAVLVQVTLAH
jgi:uncharacterized protein